MIVDTHMHIFEAKYDDIREDVINEALCFDVKIMIAVGYDYQSSLRAIALANKYDFIYCAVGLHPSEVHKEKDNSLSWITELAKNKKVIAIGEIGLDYYWDKTYIDLQKEMFLKQINIAKKLDLPIIIHNRESTNDCYQILKNNQGVKGVLHCYSSSLEMAKEFIKLGFYLGIGGVLTFKNSKEIKRVVENVDLENLLSETDSPYLTPMPYRGQLNHPGYTKFVVEEISRIKNIDLEIVKDVLFKNVKKLFKIGD